MNTEKINASVWAVYEWMVDDNGIIIENKKTFTDNFNYVAAIIAKYENPATGYHMHVITGGKTFIKI